MSAPAQNIYPAGTAPVPQAPSVYDEAMSGGFGATVPHRHYEAQIPETQWRHPERGSQHATSVYVELGGSERAVLPGTPYGGVREGGDHPTEQELVGIVEAGEEHFGILGIRATPTYGRTPARNYVLVRLDPAGRAAPEVVGVIPPLQSGQDGMMVGRAHLDQERFPGQSGEMSGHHFAVGVHNGDAGPQVVVTDIGSTNGTVVFAPNTADFRGKERLLEQAWGGSRAWALRPEVAQTLRRSAMRELPGEAVAEPVGDPQWVDIPAGRTVHTPVDASLRERHPLHNRREMRDNFGLDADVIGVVVAAPGAGEERFTILDRGHVPHGEEYSLYEGGPLLREYQRYVLADAGFLRAAHEARIAGDPDMLLRYVADHGGMRVIDSHSVSEIAVGRRNWARIFGDEAGDRVEKALLVSAGHLLIRFDHTDIGGCTVIDQASSNGTRIMMGPRRRSSTAHAAGAPVVGTVAYPKPE